MNIERNTILIIVNAILLIVVAVAVFRADAPDCRPVSVGMYKALEEVRDLDFNGAAVELNVINKTVKPEDRLYCIGESK